MLDGQELEGWSCVMFGWMTCGGGGHRSKGGLGVVTCAVEVGAAWWCRVVTHIAQVEMKQ